MKAEYLLAAGVAICMMWVTARDASSQIITVNPAVTYQPSTGAEVLAWAPYELIALPAVRLQVARMAAELGIDRLRVEVRCGAENSVDWFHDWQDGVIPYATWRAHR